MKKVGLLPVIGLLFVFVLPGIALTLQNGPEGFGGLRWGDPPSEDMMNIETTEGTQIFIRPSEKFRLQNVRFGRGYYFFCDRTKEFMGILMIIDSKDGYDSLETLFKASLGEQTHEDFSALWWENQDAVVVLRYSSEQQFGSLSFWNKSMLFEKGGVAEQKVVR